MKENRIKKVQENLIQAIDMIDNNINIIDCDVRLELDLPEAEKLSDLVRKSLELLKE